MQQQGNAARNAKPSAMQIWSTIGQTPELVSYFEGVFAKAGITVEETGEAFTVMHHGDRIAFAPGLADDVEFVVPIHMENVTRLAAHARDGKFDAEESWRIVQALFTPLTRAALQSPLVTRNWLRALAGVETLIHVHLLHPSGGDSATHTLAFAGNQWLVLSGLHGTPQRTYRLTPAQALDFQRQLYQALKTNTPSGWWQFANWYRQWRVTKSSRL
jgi:hypothetical protein